MDSRVADADAPDLSVWAPGQQALGGLKRIFCHLECCSVHVEGYDLAAITGLYQGLHALLIYDCAAARVLFYAVAGLGAWHGLSPVLPVNFGI
jgi:hypothetical protein